MLFVLLQRIFFTSAHKIDIELCNSRPSQRANLFNMRLGGTEQAEAVGDFIGNEFALLLSTSQ